MKFNLPSARYSLEQALEKRNIALSGDNLVTAKWLVYTWLGRTIPYSFGLPTYCDLLIIGESGSGKTRLIKTLASEMMRIPYNCIDSTNYPFPECFKRYPKEEWDNMVVVLDNIDLQNTGFVIAAMDAASDSKWVTPIFATCSDITKLDQRILNRFPKKIELTLPTFDTIKKWLTDLEVSRLFTLKQLGLADDIDSFARQLVGCNWWEIESRYLDVYVKELIIQDSGRDNVK